MATAPNFNLALRNGEGQTFVLEPTTVLGRETDCQIVIADAGVSRYHAKLTVASPQTVLVEDLHSPNGTFINGRKLDTPQILTVGDALTVHATAFWLTSLNPDIAQEGEFLPQKALPAEDSKARSAAVAAEYTEQKEHKSSRQFSEAARKEVQFLRPTDALTGPRLVVLTAPIRGKIFALETAALVNSWNIGRSEELEISLIDSSVSKQHARVIKQGGRWRLENLSEDKPLYLNDSRIDEGPLQDGDRIRLGRTELQFHAAGLDTRNLAASRRVKILRGRSFFLFTLGIAVIAAATYALVLYLK